jgi:hypothetical protein
MGQDSGFGIQDSADGGTANDTFRIDHLTLRNFRCFEEKTIHFHPRFNVLIGDNGSGKTAVVDALACCFTCAMVEAHVEHGGPVLGTPDARRETIQAEPISQMEAHYPVDLRLRTTAGSVGVYLKAATLPTGGTRGGLQLFHRQYDAGLRPLVAYYGEARYSASRSGTADGFVGQQPRVHGYVGCLAATANAQYMLRWMKQVEVVRLQEEGAVPALDMAKAAITACVPGLRDLIYRIRDDELTVDMADGRSLPFRMLPSGVRSMLAMVADMAWRASFLNPDLGADAARETPGVVLIDEIDLHLHPKWQRHVVDDLKRAFPKVQFIVTTHSPFIIQSLEPGELITLDEGEQLPAEVYFRRSIEDIAEDAMGVPVPSRSAKFQEMVKTAERYFGLLREGEAVDPAQRDELKRQLDELMARFSDDPAWVALLSAEREAAGPGVGVP